MLIDGFDLGGAYGFGRCILELCRSLGKVETDWKFIVAVRSSVDQAILPEYPNVRWHRLPGRNRLVWEQFAIPRLARELSCDLIHFPSNTMALNTKGIACVTTIHDVLFLKSRVSILKFKYYLKELYIKWCFKYCTRRARALISVSKATQTALRKLGFESEVIYNTVDGFIANVERRERPSEIPRYLLHRGGGAAHKNSKRIIDAFREARGSLPDVHLKVLGLPNELVEKWRIPGEQDIEFVRGQLPETELSILYAESSCIVVASLEEGFGLLIIEAFGLGVPVITSNIDPMQEVAGDAALLVDPYNVSEISKAMVAVLTDPALAQSLAAKGSQRLGAFSSKNVGDQILDVYRRCSSADPISTQVNQARRKALS